MPSLLTIAMVLTMFSMAFPPLLLVAAVFWFLVIRTGRRKVRAARAKVGAAEQRRDQAKLDKAVRYFL